MARYVKHMDESNEEIVAASGVPALTLYADYFDLSICTYDRKPIEALHEHMYLYVYKTDMGDRIAFGRYE